MIKFKELNDISPELQKAIPKLGPNDSAEYRLLSMRKDPENEGQWLIPFIQGIPSRYTIVDPGTDSIADIAYITRIKSKTTKSGRVEEPDIPVLAFTRSQGGRITLQGNNPQDRLLHEYLFLCPLNAASPLASNSVKAIYEYVDVKAKARKGIERMNRKLEAMRKIAELTEADGLFDYAYMVAQVETKDVEVARYQLAEYAEADADKFFNLIESVDSQIKVAFLRGLSQGVLFYDAESGTVRWSKSREIICSIPKAVKDRGEAFAIWAKASAANMKTVDTITAMTTKNKPAVTPPVAQEEDVEESDVEEKKSRRGRPPKREEL